MSVDTGQNRIHIDQKHIFFLTSEHYITLLSVYISSTHAASSKSLIKTRHRSVNRKEAERRVKKAPKSYLCSWLRSYWLRLKNTVV